jgi:hypothetical protein
MSSLLRTANNTVIGNRYEDMTGHMELAGEWENVSETNLDGMLQQLGVGYMKRKMAVQVKPSQKISFDGNKMKVITESSGKSGEKIIPLDGSEFSDEIAGSKAVMSANIKEDGSINSKGKVSNMEISAVRRIDETGQMILTTSIGGVECVRVFTRK